MPVLFSYCLAYNIVTLIFVSNIYKDQSASLGYMYFFPAFWILAGLILIILYVQKKVRFETRWEKVLLILSTPGPFLVLVSVLSMLAGAL
ncbi:hypothetical protein [Flavihumibacter petaseus]|uniref:Uncharacterized protein n=1 Tax=Flavihumibacter petaseus NBRC 106054 TaxID=1220578 RepID=A0A0E9MVG3_9BACT|nr:hypothetical protein [Flavihumibacter petaseus]GAO41401.1 hypothetical protein FPE01S_01_04130 [Flavihumibacter petaseus NBRC 106054]